MICKSIDRMGAVLADVRYAVRRLLGAPAFTAFALLRLTIAIGANTSLFSLLDAFGGGEDPGENGSKTHGELMPTALTEMCAYDGLVLAPVS